MHRVVKKNAIFATMFRLDQYIKRLLREHECVVVPGLGAFIAHYEGAVLSAEEGYITPPRREVGLNPSLTHNDGLLAGSVSRREGISYEAALDLIAGDVAAMRARLAAEGQLLIEGVGTLIRPETEGQTPGFIPLSDGFYNGAYNLLQPIALPEPMADAKDVDEQQMLPGTGRRFFTPWVRIAASVAVVMALGAALFTGINETATRGADTASLVPTHRLISTRDTKSASLAKTVSKQEAAKTAAEIKIVEPKDPVASVTVSDRVLEVPAGTKRFYLIVASLPTYARAQSYIATHNGKKHMAIVRAGRSRYRICMAISSTFEGAMAHKQYFNAFYPDSWIAWDE